MPQLPLLIPAPGASAPQQLTESVDAAKPLEPVSPQEHEAGSFEQALQDSMEKVDDDNASKYAWFSMLLQEQSGPLPMLSSGKCLPHIQSSDGKVLPLQAIAVPQEIQLQLLQESTLKANMQTEVVPQLSQERLVAQAEGDDVLFSSKLSGQLVQGLDVRTMGNILQQPTQIGSQSVDTTLSLRPGSPTLSVDIPVNHSGWDKAIGHRIQWLIGQNVQEAELKLTPPNLGPLEIRISLQNDQTSVSFIAPQALTREALEVAMPRLKEMLGEVNLNLTHVDVGHRGGDSSHAEQSSSEKSYLHAQGRHDTQLDSQDRPLPTSVTRGLVDDYV